jgi:hypothetical protein
MVEEDLLLSRKGALNLHSAIPEPAIANPEMVLKPWPRNRLLELGRIPLDRIRQVLRDVVHRVVVVIDDSRPL